MKKRIIALILALLILLTGCSNVVPSAASEVPENPYSEETPLPSATWYQPPTTPQKEYDGENAAQDVISAIRQAENEIANGDYDGTLDDRVDEILSGNNRYQRYADEQSTESSNRQAPRHDTDQELYISPDAEPKMFSIKLSGYEPAPSWVHLSALLIDGIGRDIELPDIDEGGPYQFDDAELFCPGQVMIKIFVYVDDSYLDGDTVESHGKIYCDSCVFDLSDDAFEEYVDGIQRGELSASMSIVYDPDPDNHAEHDTVYEEYLLNIEVSIEREY